MSGVGVAGNAQFVRQRARPISMSLTRNLARLARSDGAAGLGWLPFDAGSAAVLIGGGPSCSGFDRIDGDPLVVCVNTSAVRVCRELTPDVLCVREVVSCADQLRALDAAHLPRLVVVDMQVHPEVPVAAAERGIPVMWTLPAQQHLYWLAALLDERPIYAGESALTQCAAMATRLGVGAVSLIGCNMAFGADGTAYGHGTAWSGVSVTRTADGYIDFGDRGGMREHSAASGIPGPPLSERADPVVMEDGSEGYALATWVSQRLWLEQWATRNPDERRANLSGGARIEGWPKAERTLPGHKPAVPTTAIKVERIDAEIRRQIRCAREVVDGRAYEVPDAVNGFPLVEMAAAADYLATHQRQLPERVRLEDLRTALRKATDAVEAAYTAEA